MVHLAVVRDEGVVALEVAVVQHLQVLDLLLRSLLQLQMPMLFLRRLLLLLLLLLQPLLLLLMLLMIPL